MSRWKRKKPPATRMSISGQDVVETENGVVYRMTEMGDKRVAVFIAPDAGPEEVTRELRLLAAEFVEPSWADVFERLGLA